jgi:hypothetical protein
MIFVSYSHKNAEWLERWQMMSKPMSKANEMSFWSDINLQAGEWEAQINDAMQKSEAVVLLVSPAFLASDFIMTKELPHFLNAHEKQDKQIFWLYLEPCDMRHYPARRIKEFQAITFDGNLKPLSDMKNADWQRAMICGCEMVDDYLRKKERPIIHANAKKKPLLGLSTPDFQILEKPPRRRVEVLVYAGGQWWKQGGVNPGSKSTKITLGDKNTKAGAEFKVAIITTDQPLHEQAYLNIPNHRTKQEIILKRK